MSRYQVVSGTVFALVAAAQLTRALAAWPAHVGSYDVPVWFSYVAFAATAALAAWAFRAR